MRIFVEAIQMLGKHGVFPEEREHGREFVVDLAVDCADTDANDALERTLDYRSLAHIVSTQLEGESVQLVETLADRILTDALLLPNVQHAQVTIRKRATDVPGNPAFVGVSMERSA